MRSVILCVLMTFLAVPVVYAQENEPLLAGNRILCIDINEAEDGDYQAAFDMAVAAGAQNVNLSFDWRDLEMTPGEPGNDIFPIINLFFPPNNMPVSLFIRPISTGVNVMPEDLQGKAFDDPQVIERFRGVLDYVFEQTPDTEITTIIVGSEIDAYLGTDETLWEQYTTFFREAAAYIKAKNPDVLVATEGLFGGMVGDAQPYFEEIHQYADVVGVSYYPLNPDFTVRPVDTIQADFEEIVEIYGEKPIHFFQLGYPSSEALNSSEAMQAAFIREVFRVWDIYAEQIQSIKFTWLHEISADSVTFYEDYYSFSSEGFVEFLGSLGLRHREGSGTDKPAFVALKEEAAARGW